MRAHSIHRYSSLLLQAILLGGAFMSVWEQQWLNTVATTGIILITFFPLFLERRYRVYIPSEFELLAIAFVFAALFLGEIRGFYLRFWWWDLILHTTSGVLLGILGLLLVHLLNEMEDVEVNLKPGFVALFAFLFAVGMGTLWEVFEYGMDQLFGMNMQKATVGDPSGLTDTMWDLIVDAGGALVISVLGYGWLKTTGNESLVERLIYDFIEHNPRLFNHH
jgi:hypothetical protein